MFISIESFQWPTREEMCDGMCNACGESGAIGAPAAVMSALLDALQTDELEMPATPHAVWRAIMRK